MDTLEKPKLISFFKFHQANHTFQFIIINFIYIFKRLFLKSNHRQFILQLLNLLSFIIKTPHIKLNSRKSTKIITMTKFMMLPTWSKSRRAIDCTVANITKMLSGILSDYRSVKVVRWSWLIGNHKSTNVVSWLGISSQFRRSNRI